MKILYMILVFALTSNGCAINDKIVHLSKCTDPNVIMDLQSLLNSYHYTKLYDSDDFNCVEFTIACMQFLDKNGYDVAAMAYLYGENNSCGHCYPIVKINNKGWIAIESCYSKTHGFTLGYITSSVSENKYNYLNGVFFNDTNEINEFDAGPEPVYTGDLTRFIVKNS